MSHGHREEGRSGQVILLAPLMIVVLGAMVALAGEVGQIVVGQGRLQNAADAAALGAAQVLVSERADGAEESIAREVARLEAALLGEANAPGARLTVEFGTLEGRSFVPLSAEETATAARARAIRDDEAPAGPLPLAFAALLGVRRCDVSAGAVCRSARNIRGFTAGLSPFAVERSKVVEPGQTMTLYPGDESESSGTGTGQQQTAPGNWGLLNLDGGSLSVGELEDWILNGYEGRFELSEDGHLYVDGTTGFRTTLESEVQERIGDELTVVVFDEASGSGSGATYRCVNFLVIEILDCRLTGRDKYAKCKVSEVLSLHDVIVGGDRESPNIRKIELVR